MIRRLIGRGLRWFLLTAPDPRWAAMERTAPIPAIVLSPEAFAEIQREIERLLRGEPAPGCAE